MPLLVLVPLSCQGGGGERSDRVPLSCLRFIFVAPFFPPSPTPALSPAPLQPPHVGGLQARKGVTGARSNAGSARQASAGSLGTKAGESAPRAG